MIVCCDVGKRSRGGHLGRPSSLQEAKLKLYLHSTSHACKELKQFGGERAIYEVEDLDELVWVIKQLGSDVILNVDADRADGAVDVEVYDDYRE